ncbi:hypothetical protein FIBSPDRAFT_1044721 [Athelia psychrophila]|uniref:DUF6533 domain-containing protein n=1 Tax=Athelia psychrophila TaxID=1759441 RepID=A0A167XAB1_9AGAM|nr:hypothetical protein FIBSPDRAFT_1053231 [Fibularhizoctonia sp. CBS 109695]KZP20688.1 hypothetical protein FIBSPDRAFT_1044717 [Fibularhizoctonia sp. CBS 109695]KZP20694.1 hypothetical protein FIBSPDRAFT_1044721 [Fibularhizoctonia sp. CBS 109695]
MAPGVEESQNTAYASAAIFTVFLLDWVLCMDEEVEIVQRTRLNLPIVIYFLSRTGSLGYIICEALLNTECVPFTLPMEHAKYAFWWISGAATSLLFFFRIRAVYNYSRSMKTLFVVLWISILATPTAFMWNPHINCPSNAGNSCDRWNPLTLPYYVAVFCHDTLVFVFVSRQLVYPTTANGKNSLMSLIRGEGMHVVSKSMLRSGQLYYGATIGILVAAAVTMFLGTPYSTLLGLIYIALSSGMSCKVFRMVMLCEPGSEYSMGAINTRDVEVMMRTVGSR